MSAIEGEFPTDAKKSYFEYLFEKEADELRRREEAERERVRPAGRGARLPQRGLRLSGDRDNPGVQLMALLL